MSSKLREQEIQIDDQYDESNTKIHKTLKSLQFSNPGAKFSGIASGKRKIKSTSRFDLNLNIPLYNENGIFISTNKNLCDCLKPNCPGCHFSCKQCNSTKCGNKCRVNRTWYYERVEIEGTSSKSLEMEIND